jgi:AcrR family transcriptional regulator
MRTSDGRRVRDPEKTRAAIVEAVLGLAAEGQYFPTAAAVAERADVSPRSVFVHFADLDELAVAAARRQVERWMAHARPIAADRTLEERVDDLLAQRAKMYEVMTPIRRAGLVRESDSPGLRQVMAEGDAWFRADTAAAFAAELAADPRASAPGGLLDALDAAASWAAWDHLRSRRGLRPPAAVRAIKRVVLAVLAG